MALPALLGGAGLSLAAHELLLLTGDIFGVSGFVHRSLKGNTEAIAGVVGLVVGGIVVAALEGADNISSPLHASPAWLLLSGFLVGLGTKVLATIIFSSGSYLYTNQLANGCTSGYVFALGLYFILFTKT